MEVKSPKTLAAESNSNNETETQVKYLYSAHNPHLTGRCGLGTGGNENSNTN